MNKKTYLKCCVFALFFVTTAYAETGQKEGDTKKKDSQIATIGTVENSSLVTSPIYNFLGAAQGRLPGLNISFKPSGSMQAAFNWNVRNARTNMFMVDGIERDFFTMDPEQIESIQVLKDGLSTVMLGQRSAAGVINVITKKGTIGKPRFSFTVETGFEKALKLPEKLGAVDFMTLVNEGNRNDKGDNVKNIYESELIQKYRDNVNPYLYPDVDWYKEVLNKTTPVHRYNFNVSGASEAFRYFVDVDWYRENGFLKTKEENSYNTNGQTNRFSVRSNLGVKVTPTTYMQVNLSGRQERYNQSGGGIDNLYKSLLSTRPNLYPVLNPDGTYGAYQNAPANSNLYGLTVDRGYQFKDSRHMSFDLTINQRMDFLLNGLFLEATGSYYSQTSFNTTRTKDFAAYWYKQDESYQQIGSDGDQGNSGSKDQRYRITYLKGTVGYEHSFDKHHLSAAFVADINQIQNQNDHTGFLKNYTNYSGRINYDYDNRYLAEAIYTRGGYNWFAPGHRWANYWGAGASWNAHNETFMKDLNIFSTFKPRITYALTGQATCNYAEYIQSYITGAGNLRISPYGDGFKFSHESNTASFLNPEKAKKMDIGVDLGFFNDRLTATFDYYRNKYTDVVAMSEIKTSILGTTYPRTNCQEFSYTGYELSLSWQDRIRDFNYYVTGNLSLDQSKLDYTPELPKAYPWMSSIGDPVGMTYGYIADGIFQNQQEIDNYDAFLTSAVKSTIKPGDIRYKDLNEDGVIDIKDQTNLGSKKAKGYYGITAGFSYKGFDFSAFVQGTLNRQVYLNGDFMHGSGNSGNNAITSYVLDRWTKDNPTNTQTRMWYGDNKNNTVTSSFWLYNADYIRLKNVEVGYTLPANWTRKIGIPSIRIYANGMNLLTASEIFDVRDDIDPEVWGGSYPMTRTINFGVSIKL